MGILNLAIDLEGSIRDDFHYDEAEDRMTFSRTQDVEPILKANKRLFTADDGYSPSRDFRRAASIPVVLLEKWLNEEGLRWWEPDGWEKILAKLDDPDFKFLRTAPGRLSRRPTRSLYVTRKGTPAP